MSGRPGRSTLNSGRVPQAGQALRGEHAGGTRVNGQGGSFAAPRPGRGARGWAAEAAYGGGYPQDAQLVGPALDTGAYAVDPGYQGRTSDRPRPADMPPGPPRSRPDRGMPPRPGFPPGSPRQGPRDAGTANRPWIRPED